MSFFGFETTDRENERQRFLDAGLREEEDIAVYNWGQDDYDGLGNALQEGGDELNDETFGVAGPVGKDFDFLAQALPSDPRSSTLQSFSQQQHHQQQEQETQDFTSISRPSQSSRQHPSSLEAIWDDKSPFSVLPRAGSNTGRASGTHQTTPSGSLKAKVSPYVASNAVQQSPLLVQQAPVSSATTYATTGVRTLQEIEAEMRARSQQSRALQAQAQAQAQHQKPPRMRSESPSAVMLRHSQPPNNLAWQQQIQEQQERQRVEEIERQLREQSLAQDHRRSPYMQQDQQQSHSRMMHQRQSSGPYEQLLQQQQQHPSPQRIHSHAHASPAVAYQQTQPPLYNQLQNLQSMQMQQRILAQLAQAEFTQGMNGVGMEEQEVLRVEAMRKIMEAERMEGKRRRKAAKINHMSRYNDLMTQSDKDFITRIQVSQLVTSDPYAEDFYAQVYGSLLRSRMGLNSQDERVLKFGSGEGVGLGLGQRGAGRRPNAMQRMEAQVERIVSNARQREREKGLHGRSHNDLQGALGKTAGRSYKAAPRQLLQVETVDGKETTSPTMAQAHAHISKEDAKDHAAGAAKEAAKRGREALGAVSADSNGAVTKEPLTQREALIILESLYDTLLEVEQLRREQPPQEEEEHFQEWSDSYDGLVKQLWDGLNVMVPLETCDPHPFISLITPAKGKKLLPRLTRHLEPKQLRTILTLLVACFSQLDVVIMAPLLDSLEDSLERKEVERQTQAFLTNVMQSILHVVAKAELRLISAMLGIFLDHSEAAVAARTRPGLALLTLFLSRVEVIKQSMMTSTIDPSEIPSNEDSISWQSCYDHLFHVLAPHFLSLFPSTRLAASGVDQPTEVIDQPVWQFLAALALHANNEQQQILVATLREKVLDNLVIASKGWTVDEDERSAKIANVNLFLHALGLDSSQINL